MILVLAYSDITPFSEKCSQKTLTFKKAYDNYLQSDIVDSRGKKTKALVYRLTGYSPGQLSAALELCKK